MMVGQSERPSPPVPVITHDLQVSWSMLGTRIPFRISERAWWRSKKVRTAGRSAWSTNPMLPAWAWVASGSVWMSGSSWLIENA